MASKADIWDEAKRRCRLNDEDIVLAKRLGLNPKRLIKNIPSKSEPRGKLLSRIGFMTLLPSGRRNRSSGRNGKAKR